MWLVLYAKSMSEIFVNVSLRFQSAYKSCTDPETDAARLWNIASRLPSDYLISTAHKNKSYMNIGVICSSAWNNQFLSLVNVTL